MERPATQAPLGTSQQRHHSIYNLAPLSSTSDAAIETALTLDICLY